MISGTDNNYSPSFQEQLEEYRTNMAAKYYSQLPIIEEFGGVNAFVTFCIGEVVPQDSIKE